MFVFARIVGIVVVIAAAIIVSLGIFGVFSSHEIRDSIQKIVEVAGVVVVASVLIGLAGSHK